MRERRVSVPIVLAIGLVLLTVALTVGWSILVTRDVGALAEGLRPLHWVLIVFGSLCSVAIIAAAILQAVWLVREIRFNQRQKNFLDAVTHELHTPLASLRLYLETLSGRDLVPEKRREFLSVMGDDIDRLQSTIDQILNAAHSEPRRVRRRPIDLLHLLQECAQEVCARHDLESDALSLDIPRTARVRGDAEQLRVVFRNLIDNAVRYAGGRIRVDIRARAVSARRLQVEVEDEGIGWPSSAQSTLFSRFQRLSHEAVRSTRGLGLGLFIVRNVVRAHGGSVRAESEGEGRGSRFIVVLPGQVDASPRPAG